jgi:hypothetical protein
MLGEWILVGTRTIDGRNWDFEQPEVNAELASIGMQQRPMKNNRTTRREFLRSNLVTGAALWLPGRPKARGALPGQAGLDFPLLDLHVHLDNSTLDKVLVLSKERGVKFTFGSNDRYPEMGKLDYCVAIAQELGLKREDMFTPLPDGQKAVQRRRR